MFSFQGSVEVASASSYAPTTTKTSEVASSPPAQDASSGCLDTINTLFAARREQEPSAKRRKHVSGAAYENVEMTDATADSQEPMVLELESVRREAPHAPLQIALFNPSNDTGVHIVTAAPPPSIDAILPHLRNAATLGTTRQGKKSKAVSRAAFCRCLLHRPAPAKGLYRLEVEMRWTLGISVVEGPEVRGHYVTRDLKLLSAYMSDAVSLDDKKWTLSDFYESVHVPPKHLHVSPRIKQAFLDTTLLPFQERTVDWLLRREGVAYSPSGALDPFVNTSPPASFRRMQDATGLPCYVSQLRGTIVTDLDAAKADPLQSLQGGILAEEMGLGKTVELIALILHHKRELPKGNVYDTYTGAHVKASGGTLIITPPSILEQWISEMHAHAPELKVCHYKGLPSATAPKKHHPPATVDYLMQHDVVVTTYQVLSKEIHHAIPPPDRSSRRVKRHERRTSPLMGISWWRVCLDEAQMVENGVSQAAQVARIIPRCNAWAVTGTPLRKDIQDLRGLLIFLRCDAFANNTAVWSRLDKASFKGIFNEITLRNTKDKIRDEVQLPPQKRIVITVPFTAIEEQYYDEMMQRMCDSCWLTSEGLPEDEERGLDDPEIIERMRDWLVRLRQTCLHANVGRRNRKALGTRSGALRTVQEVLEIMIDQNDAKWKAEAREMILCLLKQGHIQAYAGDFANRAKSAIPYYTTALSEAQLYVASCRTELLEEEEKLGRTSTAAPREAGEDGEVEAENVGRIPVLRKSLRSFLELEHAAQFFTATAHHQIKEDIALTEPGTEEWHVMDRAETSFYDAAKSVRRELLQEAKRRAQQQMTKVNSKKPFHQIPKIKDLPDLGGIEARKILDTMDNISDYLNAQAKQIETWRSKIVDILLTRLMDDDDDQETTGEEYDESLKAQDELYVYIMGLRTLVADRHAAVHGLKDPLTEHELKAAEKQALKKEGEGDRGHAPELVIEIVNTRNMVKSRLQAGSLKGILSGIRTLVTSVQWKANAGDVRAAAELSILEEQIKKVQAIAAEQAKAITELEKEQEMYRGTMNQRLEYYRQFQNISDSVAKYKEDLDEKFDARAFNETENLRAKKKNSAAGFKTKCTYLRHLRSENQNETTAECIICREDIESGVLTTCGHKYCKDCINQWWRSHRTCPTCKQKLGSSDFKDISFKPSEIKAQEEEAAVTSANAAASTPAQEASSSSTPNCSTSATTPPSIYTDISTETMKQIQNIDLPDSYGTKIDTIARHLLWIRANDPGAKSILFSQFSDFFTVLREAFKKWNIGATSINEPDGIRQFKSDPAVECLLLDAKSDSSGLTLVNATYVFLCEPLINPAIELQAVSRVHRIGQTRGTTVYMYLVGGTVEEAIYDISVKRRLEYMTRSDGLQVPGAGGEGRDGDGDTRVPDADAPPSSSLDHARENYLDKADSAHLASAPLKNLLHKKGNGEVVPEADLWHCLFGKRRKAGAPVVAAEGAVGSAVEREVAKAMLLEMRVGFE
ncbi:ATP-dependent DNA helicase [Stemphylium lycopersici]|uniref:ATP-dependent DNA helicase n=1 Tax=Stemphylium lycopersici TaxID=183478 RepID=A0A364NEY9_STELY|nr:ATP-dependent DNA helicase [Stemphylium lycopersici]